MIVIYVGDSRDVVKRVHSNHCGGNVEASALRRHIALNKGYTLRTSKRAKGSLRVRLDLLDPRIGEQDISAYLKSGMWRFVVCSSYNEAHNFQWYVIEHLKPILNVSCQIWNKQQQNRYATLMDTLVTSPGLNCSQLDKAQSGPGVYVLYHESQP